MNIEYHPAATLFPMMDEVELRKLAEDIRANGQLEPITLYHGEILDGRNRYRACQLAEVEPKLREVNGELASPVTYVISHNLHRRHLTVGQRAAIAALLMPMLAEEAKKRQEDSRARPGEQIGHRSRPIGHGVIGSTRKAAAEAVGVGETSVARAVRIRQDSPENFEKLQRGEIGTWSADPERKDKNPPRSASDAYEVKTPRQAQLAESQKRKMIDGLSMVGGVCHGLENLDVALVVAVCTEEEIATWVEKAFAHSRDIRTFAAKLRHQGEQNGRKSEPGQDVEDAGGSTDAAPQGAARG